MTEILGSVGDAGTGWVPVDLDTANGATGKRISLTLARSITFIVELAVGATDDVVLDVQQHTAYTSGTSADLDSTAVSDSTGVDHYYIKSEAVLDNDEIWTKVTQTAASEITLTGATYGDKQNVIWIDVDARQLGAGYTHVSLNASTTTSTAHLGSCLYLVHGMRYRRTPSRLPNLLRPGVANA
jgi:hypothetical protein